MALSEPFWFSTIGQTHGKTSLFVMSDDGKRAQGLLLSLCSFS